MRTFKKPFSVHPPICGEELEHFTKETGRTDSAYQRDINSLWTVEDRDGQIISSHKTEAAAKAAAQRANESL